LARAALAEGTCQSDGLAVSSACLLGSFEDWSNHNHSSEDVRQRAARFMMAAEIARDGAGNYAWTVLNAMPSAVLAVDRGLTIAFVNPAAEQLFGVSRPVLEARPLAELLPFDSPLFDLIRRVGEAGSGVSDYGVELLLGRGEAHLVDVHVSPLDEQRGDHLVVLHPCSVAQRLNRQLSHRGGARAVAGLGATLAHEVKNPLSGIRGAAQLLEGSLAEDERPLIRLICDEADRICALVDRMEAFADGKPIERRPVNIYQVLERVRRVSESGFGRRVRFVERYDPSLPEVDGDHDQLVQVFLNLIKNAAEAVPAEGGEIRISTQYTHGLSMRVANSRERVELPILVEIQDNGPGVSEEMVPHLFEPFVSSKRSGTGLGLSLAAKIVGDHGGVIEFQNQPRGALFRVRLPAWRAGRPATAT
jgi:two-component system, NtrC family, nitrogen regulation sensor histidine kinase GlnL